MTGLSVKLKEGDLARMEQRAHTIARPALERIVQRAAPYAQQQASAGAPQKTGALASSISAQVHDLELRVSSSLPYAMPVEFGRHPGAQMPPPDAFGGGPEGFLIARAIAGRGIKGRFFLRRAKQMLQTVELPRLMNVAADEIERDWAKR